MKNRRKSIYIILILVIVYNLLGVNNSVYAFLETDIPYELNKNYRFSVNDINSEEIRRIYDPDNIEIPKKFNLKDTLKEKFQINIPVANQQTLGLCDTFATVKCVETNYALKTGKYIDLSERYLDYMTSKYFYDDAREPGILPNEENNNTSEEGDGSSGSDVMTFLETYGAPTEEQIPYKNYSLEQESELRNAIPALRVTSTVELPSIQNLSDGDLKEKWIDILKIHIMKYGSINTSINAPVWGTTFNGNTNAQYYKEGVTEGGGGHAISIVGWDDNFSKSNFLVEPEHDGAFIILNSWGKEWADEGYFYISYDDDNITLQLTGVLDTEVPEKYNEYTYAQKLFAHSGFGLINNKRFYGIRFTRNSNDEFLSHITIGAGGFSSENFSTKVKYYLNPEDDSFDKEKMILLEETNSIARESHTNINLNEPIKIKGQKFSLVFEFVGDDSDIMFTSSKDSHGNSISGNLYYSNGFDELWNIANDEFPVYAFTINKKISNININKVPNKTTYIKGEKLDLTGGMISVMYEDGSTEEVPITSGEVAVTGYNANALGQQEITVSYNEKIAKFNVTVKNGITGIRVKTSPTKTTYIKGEKLDLTGGMISVMYEDGSTAEVPMTSSEVRITGYDSDTLGTQIIKITYNKKVSEYKITVIEKDTTEAKTDIPQAGEFNKILIPFVITIGISVVSFIKYIKYNKYV